jgi:hypothetical protein
MAIAYNTSVVRDGLVLYLDAANPKSYPGSGTNWLDLKSLSNATIENGVTFNSANKGHFVFDGINDQVSFLSNPSLTNQITVEAWVNLSATTPNGNAWILGREGSYRLLYSSNSFQWICATSNNAWYTTGTAISFTIPATSKIYQVVATYNGSNIKLYIDGLLVSTGSTISGNILNNGTYFLFRSGAGNIDYGKGNLYTHRLYNRALSDLEIKTNFEATRGRYSI